VNAALAVELLKLRRSTAARTAGVAVVVGVAGLSAGFMALARSGGDSAMAAKVEPLIHGSGWEAYLGMVGQVLSVAVLLSVGVVTCWSFGREFVDGTFGSLFAIPTPRGQVALAKYAVLAGWGLLTCTATVLVAIALGTVIGLGAPGGAALGSAVGVLVVGGLTVLLALPLGWVASVLRGYLPGIAALLAVVVATQVATVLGSGAWFPYAAPGLWAGMGGTAAAAEVSWVQLAMAFPVAIAGVVATVVWWRRAEVR
jgi:ABC-2 type transport system permease protein